jgi:sigma-B regulation protein RsbU (phosphoserine phosphatase)
MKLKQRVLIQTLSASLVFTLLLSSMFFISVDKIRKNVRVKFGELGNHAAGISAYALEEQAMERIARIAGDTALILDEKFSKIENHTRTTADIAGSIYTHKEFYRPVLLPHALQGQIAPSEPYLFSAPGLDLSLIQAETGLAGNIANMLRQITVIDRGIATSAIGGESGYIIAMDAFPWPCEYFDHRSYSWYQGAKESGALYWTEVYVDPRGRGPAISCAVPFYDSSGRAPVFKGVARSTVMLAGFSRIINSAGIGRTGYLFLVDQNGIKNYSSGSIDVKVSAGGIIAESFLDSANPAVRSLGRSMTMGASGMAELEMDGIPVYAAYAPIQTLGWSLGVVMPVQEVISPAWLIREQIQKITNEARSDMDRHILLMSLIIGLMLLASLVTIAFFSVRFTAGLTGPILALNAGVQEVSGGSLDREVRVKTGDELEQLACSFNTMTIKLREHIAQIAKATAEKQRIHTELDIAMRIQTSMLPGEFPPFANRKNEFDLFAAVHPAKEVGGDFYDFFFIDDDHFAVVVADVSGKGVPAALFMAITMTLIRNHLQTGEAAELVMDNVNRQLCANNIADMFVTVWLGVLEISSGRLVYVNAGHNPPLISRGAKGFTFLVSPPDLVLAGMDDTLYHRRETFIASGDTLFLYTDGITEAADAEGGFYGKERLRDFLDARIGLPLRELLPALRAGLAEFSRGAEQSDDITMLALRIGSSALRSITLPAAAEQLGALIGFIGKELDEAACPEKSRGQIELAAEEIFVNIARYAYKGEGEVLVSCGIGRLEGKNTLTLSFADRGGPFNPLEHEDPDINIPLEQREPGGLGVLIVKRIMDTVIYNYDGTMNRLTITKSWQE